MPNRIIKESINESEGLASVSISAIDLFKRLITYADDYGRFNSNLEILRARLYPLETEVITTAEIHDWLGELCGIGKVEFYTAKHDNGPTPKIYGFMVGWEKHQRIRNSHKKCPDPGDPINDWALQRFVPLDLKILIYERDKFECQDCQKSFQLDGIDTRRAIRLIGGFLHVDHIVPVKQGGRATVENLRLLCDSCNLARSKKPSTDELRRLAASCGDSRRKTAQSNPNPIQSESYKSARNPSGDSSDQRLKNRQEKKPEAYKAPWGEVFARLYLSDQRRFAKLSGWIDSKRRTHRYADSEIAAALARFEAHDKSSPVDNWWPYLDILIDRHRAKTNAREFEGEHERRKGEEREWAKGNLLGI